MITNIQTIEQLKQLFLEILINKTDKVSDVSDNSILNATAFGAGKVAQKCLKDIALVESHIFPDSAVGSYLDDSAELFGVPGRKDASGSSTYLRVSATAGTQYLAATHIFSNYNGVQFEMTEDFTVGDEGWGYIKIRSQSDGDETNVESNTVITVSPEPAGHIACSNEYQAIGGADAESDELFRMRIKKHLNIVSRNTIEYLTEVSREFEEDTLSLINLGINENGRKEVAIVLNNGKDLTQNELDQLLEDLTPYFCLSDISVFGDSIGIDMVNIEWQHIDVDFRVQVNPSYDTDEVRKDIQTRMTKLVDFRFWERGSKVEWDDLLESVKNTEGVKYVPDIHFYPQVDIKTSVYKLPRIRGFIMRDLDGNVIIDNNEALLPISYPSE